MYKSIRQMLTILILAAGFTLAPVSALAQEPPPQLDLKMRPITEDGRMQRVEVEMRIEAPELATGEPLLRLPLTIVSIPTSAYDASDLTVSDEVGAIPLTQRDEEPRPEGVYRQYFVQRATKGDVIVRYAARPRTVSAQTNNGPLFDMREENGGFTGAGISFLAVPTAKHPYRTSVRWDLSQMPPGSIGVWSLGEGNIEAVAPAEQLAFTFYGAGPFRKYKADPAGRLTVYALSPSPFDMQALTGRIGRLYDHMAKFFGDREGDYRVFARQHPYEGRGGTALPRSFTFGYHAPSNPTVDELQGMLAHEIAHGWPSMQGEHGETAWYSEGAAEYYSLVLSRRSAVLDAPKFLEQLNERALTYYAHPFRNLSNEEAAKRFWSDPFVQQVPYGRGFFYLAQTDAAIRSATGGRRSLDNVVLALRARQTAGDSYGVGDWLQLVGTEIGKDRAEREFRHMASGQTVPAAGAFATCYVAVREPVRRLELGFARRSVNEGLVRDLVPGSAAAMAGVREGDRMIEWTEVSEVAEDPEKQMKLVIERDGERQTIIYLPRGELVEAWRFARNAEIDATDCRV